EHEQAEPRGSHPQRLSRQTIEASIAPLRLIFWGGLLCILDFYITRTMNGVGFRFDFLNDFVGMLLITAGVFRLSEISVSDRYRNAMLFVRVIAVLGVIDAIQAHLIYIQPAFVQLVLSFAGLANLAATLCFCIAMRWLCEACPLPTAAASWRTTTILFLVIWVFPIGLLHLAGIAGAITGESLHLELGALALLLIPLFAVPLIHIFVSTSRMRRAAEEQVEPAR
ncbi:MAG: hypothetical protein ACE5GW_12265, partial [Planctomycetota bacterium]